MEYKVECPHKWHTIYVAELDYECELCGKNLFTIYGVDRFQSGELKVENFYINKNRLVDWDKYRVVQINRYPQKYVVQTRSSFLWWVWWSSLKRYSMCYDGPDGYDIILFDSFDEAVDYIIGEKVDHLKRLL